MTNEVTFGSQEARGTDPQPDRVVMVAPDGRTVQVMAEDVAAFTERGFRLAKAAPAGAKAKRGKAEEAEEATA